MSVRRSTVVTSCPDGATEPSSTDAVPVVALVGNPNGGKSTLFNALTGAKRSVGNRSGTTVEVGRGRLQGATGLGEIALLDLPGATASTRTRPTRN